MKLRPMQSCRKRKAALQAYEERNGAQRIDERDAE